MMNSNTPDLVEYLRRSSRRHPNRIAIVDGSDQLTYQQLWRRADTMAANLTRLGFSGHAIGIFSPTSAELIVTYYAGFMSSTAIVPINYSFQSGELRTVLSNCPLDALIVHESLLSIALNAGDVVSRISQKYLISSNSPCAENFSPFASLEAPCRKPHVKDAASTAVIFHTSGTTGLPKGVVHTLDSASCFAPCYLSLCRKEINPVTLISRNCYHSGGFFHFTGALSSGATCILNDNPAGFDADKFLSDLEEFKVTQIFLSVSMLNAMLLSRNVSPRAFASASFVSAGADEVKSWHHHRLRAVTNLPLSIRYSSTEATSVSINHSPNYAGNIVTVGYPNSHFEWRLDSLPGGMGVGELMLRGRPVFKGYLNNPAQNAVRFTSEGWYGTGDLFKNDGTSGLEFCGRSCHSIKVGGKFVYPEEIETVANAFSDFEETIAVAIPDAVNIQVPYLFARRRRNVSSFNLNQFRLFMSERLAKYKVPVGVSMVDEFPKTVAGKIDRITLTHRASIKSSPANDRCNLGKR